MKNGNVYEQFDAATKCLSAWAVFEGADYIGRVVFKRAASGGQSVCFMQVWGAAMVRGLAKGYGYDKDGASAESAAKKMKADDGADPAALAHVRRWQSAMTTGEGERFNRRLEDAGYRVVHVID